MTLVKKSITITDRQDQWIRLRVAGGDYGNDSEYVRDLIRRDQERNAGREVLRAAIREGLESGVSDRSGPEIMAAVEKRLKADGRL